jgi:hypothetical protein
MTNGELLLHGLGYGAAYAALGLAVLTLSFWLLDLITPGHHLGTKLIGDSTPVTRQGVTYKTAPPSYSAGVVSFAWLLGQSAVIFTAIWTNGDSAFGWALLNTAAFSLGGALLLAAAFVIHDKLTPGDLADEVCQPGPAVPLSYTTAAALLGMAAIVCASIA